MPVPGQTPLPSINGMSEFSAFTFPPPPARPGHVVLNRFVLYETKTRFFIVGTNAPAGTRFRVLKIDRTTAPDELSITEDEAVYTKSEVDDLLEMISNGNKSTGGMREITKFYGIVGFVRFTEGYYISIITKRSPVALIGGHYVFHIDATSNISIHSSTTPTSKLDKNSDEARYLQMFQMVDLTKNFYFSYSYDITRTLQWNMTRHRSEGRNRMFVWNQYLLENAFGEQTGIENQWALPIMYGFVDQSKLSILGRNVFVTLIARRSRFFAGARFLKRGVNDRGYVANDVETEQIVSEMSTTSFYGAGSSNANPNHTSFVQHRGSIPLFWTQDGTNMSPKPAIELNVVDPYFSAAALHFDDMFKRYGSPCIVLNLIKAKEKTARESILLKEFSECIEYLNQFLPEDNKIQHIKWDMSRASKSPNENVISVLEIIAEKTFQRTGFFHSGYNQQQATRHGKAMEGSGLQNGVVRTNCIDCLDRTNAAQFIIAKCALGHQLFSLGLVAEPVVPFDCDVVNMLTEMYHDHGDTIALQYGGSHLVNTMETYRKINQWTSHSRDMIESIRRFYSNSFVDAEKQDAMNLFLGNYIVRKGRPALWELPGDYHLHNITDPELKKVRKSYTKWWTPNALLPQEVLAQRSLREAREHELERFLIHDAGYDDFELHYDGHDDGYGKDQGDDHSDRLDHYDPNLRDYARGEKDHIENLRSDDEDDNGEAEHRQWLAENGRVDSIDSLKSIGPLTIDTKAIGGEANGQPTSLPSSKISSMSSIISGAPGAKDNGHASTQLQHTAAVQGEITPSGSSSNLAATLLEKIHEGPSSIKSGRDSSLDGSILEFRDRSSSRHTGRDLRSQQSVRPGVLPMSSSSSLSSLRRYHQLRHSGSRSSMATSNGQPRSKVQFSKAEAFVIHGIEACDPSDDNSWEEYWDEYYRPKVQTSFQRLFAFNMNSTNRYIPSSVKNSAEQSPFEVRQNHSLLSQAEINAKEKAKSEKPSMLSWLGLTGSSSNDSNKRGGPPSTKASSVYSNGSKTLPLSTGRKKGFLAGIEDLESTPSKSGSHKDGTAHHSRSSRLSIASFPVSTSGASEYDEKASLATVKGTHDGKVRLMQHVPRNKEEEFELTKNVWTNISKYAIHDASAEPALSSDWQVMPAASSLPSDKTAKAENGKLEGDKRTVDEKMGAADANGKDASATGISAASAAAGPAAVAVSAAGAAAGPTAAGAGATGRTGGARTGIEEMVKRSLQPDVTVHESKEYKRYTQQFKSIRFDSVSTKGAASYGINAHASQKDEWPAHTTPNTASATPMSGSIARGLSLLHQDGAGKTERVTRTLPSRASGMDGSTMSTSSSYTGGVHNRSGVIGGNALPSRTGKSYRSATNVQGMTDLTEEEEFFYAPPTTAAAKNAGPRQGTKSELKVLTDPEAPRDQKVAIGLGNSTKVDAEGSPLSPANGSLLLSPRGRTVTATAEEEIYAIMDNPATSNNATYADATVDWMKYLPEPPILLAPMQTIIKAPSETEMVLYTAHVELPKVTLYTVGQTSLNPYWGASNGTRLRYEAYLGWIQKGRYGNTSATAQAAAAATAAAAAAAAAAATASGGPNGAVGKGAAVGNGGGGGVDVAGYHSFGEMGKGGSPKNSSSITSH